MYSIQTGHMFNLPFLLPVYKEVIHIKHFFVDYFLCIVQCKWEFHSDLKYNIVW